MRLPILLAVLALTGQALALSAFHDFRARPRKAPQPTGDPVRRVVLVHGIFESGYSWNQLRDRLARRNVHCLVACLKPSDGRSGIDQLADELQRQIDAEFGRDARVSIVGFSMGGLVSRYYVQELGGAKRCDRLITISTPHQGTYLAWCMYGKGAMQMRPGSSFLKQLEAGESKLGSTPVSSLRTPMDLVILPSCHSVWARARNRSYWVSLHPLMLTNHRVLRDLEDELLQPP